MQIALGRGAKDATTVNLARRSGTGDGIWGHATSSDEKPLRKGTPRWRLTRAAAGIGGMIIEEESHGLLVAKVTIGLTNAAQNR